MMHLGSRFSSPSPGSQFGDMQATSWPRLCFAPVVLGLEGQHAHSVCPQC